MGFIVFHIAGDGNKNKDILRPNIPGKSQDSQKDAMNLVKQKDQNAPSEKEDAVVPSQPEEETNKVSTSIEEESKEIDATVLKEENDSDITKGEEEQDVDKVLPEEKVEAAPVESNLSSDVVDELKEKVSEEGKPDTDKSSEIQPNEATSNDDSKKLDVVKKDEENLEGYQPEAEAAVNQAQETDNLETNSSDPKTVTNNEAKVGEGTTNNTQDEIEVPDHDDYLLYLEEILKRIHKEFYEKHADGKQPDMKEIIPAVRKKVLAGTNLVFSGLVPNNIPLERSRAYQVAISLGASVTQDLKKNTTHLVAVRPGTAKVFVFQFQFEINLRTICVPSVSRLCILLS